ncbi:alpha/beta hydrolase [Streptomyces prunicolor]|uniref:alpha/beta hydrolase n=1 Tax=Streptomyces prunicolor TaxID=67348 RepID=UPI0037CF5B33
MTPMRNNLESTETPDAAPDPSVTTPETSTPSESGHTDRPGPHGTLVGRIARIALIVVATILALFALLSQLMAVLPVRWWPLHVLSFQLTLLLISAGRELLGSWNIVLAALPLAAAVFLLRRGGRRRLPLVLSAVSGVALALALITTTVQVFSVHGVTGKWFLFSPSTPTVSLGRGPDRTVTYATLDGKPMKADLYLPKTSPAAGAPLVVSIHGGGFFTGSRGRTVYTSWLADHGYAVLDVDYRLAGSTEHTWNLADADVGCAMTWATAHAATYDWDMKRVATFGASAGGGLAVDVAYKTNAGTLKPSCGTAAQLPHVKTTVAPFPAVDTTTSATDTAFGKEAGEWYAGGSYAQYPERYDAVDSAKLITPSAPPTLIFQGSADHLLFAGRTKAFAAKLTAAGITNRYIEFPFMEHAYDTFSVNIGTKATRTLMLPWLQKYLGT